MLKPGLQLLGLPALMSAFLAGSALSAGGDSPLGVWIDDTGRGAVEIKDCDGKLCGQVVWLKTAGNGDTCKLRVIGGLTAAGDGTWGGGWIYDPKSKSKYNVEIAPTTGGKLQVTGYAGTKAFSRTMTWTRAPDDLKRCDEAVRAVTTALDTRARSPAEPSRSGHATEPLAATSDQLPAAPKSDPQTDRRTAPHQRVTADKPGKRRAATIRLASLGAYGLQDVTLRKSRGACSLKVSDFARVAFPC